VATVYRSDGAHPPHLGWGGFWTIWEERAVWLAELEAGKPLATAGQIYQARPLLVAGGNLRDLPVEAIVRSVRDLRMIVALPKLRDDLRAAAQQLAAEGVEWVQFTLPFTSDRDRSWEGAMLYMGAEPLAAEPVSD
jgi:hypothetical protein